ncbi:hypothetical protein WJX81_002477 [Elliptochloris bilobata]|uniref:RRM domain-containing protein n=1 Tax=Elliptochloris bilobata TaxID=381761 RepID=A0AAW1QXZ1_9CHLO
MQAAAASNFPPPWQPPRTRPVYVVLEGLPKSAQLTQRALRALAGGACETVYIYFGSPRDVGTALYTFRDLRDAEAAYAQTSTNLQSTAAQMNWFPTRISNSCSCSRGWTKRLLSQQPQDPKGVVEAR